MRKKSAEKGCYSRTSVVLVVGAFPPPVHGMALINEFMYQHLLNKTITHKIDLAPPLGPFWLKTSQRLVSVFKGVYLALNSISKWDVLYLGLSGGWGQFYELIFVTLARIFRKDIYFHHHSYAYINRTKISFWLISFVAGRASTHICLSDGMCHKLANQYARVNITYTLSNVAFILPQKKVRRLRRVKLKIGFFSNISFEKGIKIFFKTIESLRLEGIEFEAVIAGPVENFEVQKFIEENLKFSSDTRYIGAIYGVQKEKFLSEIDVLLFPTMYENEAEPLTIYECYSLGVPVISLDRGSISEIMSEHPTFCISNPVDFPEVSKLLIKDWIRDFRHLDEAGSVVKKIFLNQRKKAIKNLKLISSIMIRPRDR